MKLKYILIFLGIMFIGILGFVFFNRLDPALLAKLSFYVDLANPSVRVVKVDEGLRKEEVAEVMAKKLGWNEQEKENFLMINILLHRRDIEGRYYPQTYLINKNKSSVEVGATMVDAFLKQVDKIEKSQVGKKTNEDTAIKIASMIQREAAGSEDMMLISGIIWNRITKGMKLQIDSTLQYAKGSEEDGWWNEVDPKDKKIKSFYNTYLYKGLPLGAIANPGADAIYAAYNPQKTNCIFYLHDKNRKIHCSETYEGHKKNIALYY